MNRLEVLLPFALTPVELTRDLERELRLPALAMLLGRGRLTLSNETDGFSRALPHESWLAGSYDSPAQADNSPPLGTALARAANLTTPPGCWFVLQPVHIHIARDHLVLTDPRQLQLDESHSRTLFDIARPLFEEVGQTLLWIDAATWLLRADDWQALRTASPDAACGHNVDIWMPQGEQAREWRRLQNEVQMHWHGHAVNDERAAQGQNPVNSIWLWGGSTAATDAAAARRIFSSSAGPGPQLAALGSQPVASVDALLAASGDDGVLVLDELIAPALSQDWAQWIDHFNALETRWFAPLLAALQAGRLQQIDIVFSHHAVLKHVATGKGALRKFWKKPSLSALSA
ncbi:hypothetical protein GCM10007205_28070 [Oxalicibacterium flavum]|uniref:Regulatory protein, RpfE type n=1 Tax=Oxalicibacterium flavum TaxID=179467 RepID=A0A8J2UMD3_9BURK|nr:hypothetical protein [Oxalicibacterium flavum]GGC17455.1 hypothetical protein GCM10007205_28070 [Oxalicibacterium flavum]